MLRVRQFLSLADQTAREVLRQPVCLLLTVVCVILTVLSPLVMLFQFGESGKLARDGGLAFHLLFGLFVAGYAACSSLGRDLRSGTAGWVLSKPVGRGVFFFAKFAGVVLVVAAFSVCATVATLMSDRIAERLFYVDEGGQLLTDRPAAVLMLGSVAAALAVAGVANALTRRSFQAFAFRFLLAFLVLGFLAAGCLDRLGRWAPFALDVQWRLATASLLVSVALVMIAALAASLATRLSAGWTLAVCVGLLAGGLLADYGLGRAAALPGWGATICAWLPNWQHFWVADALDGGGRIPWLYVWRAAGYAGIWSGAVLCLGVLSLAGREMD